MLSDIQQLDRRRFLQISAATAACGLAKSTTANAPQYTPLIDTHVYVGHWPHRRLATETPSELVALLRQTNVTQAWAGSFDGLFHKDIHGVNKRLAQACRDVGDGMLIPIGTINPTLPDWEEDVRRCHESFKMPGIRLHPTYHGYKSDDPRFARLLELAAERKLFVQLVVRMTDEREQLLTPRFQKVDLTSLAEIVQPIGGLRLLIANGVRAAAEVASFGLKQSNVYFDCSRVTEGEELRALVDLASADRVVYGSAAPLSDIAADSKVLQQVDLTAVEVAGIRDANARRLMTGAEGVRR